MKNTKKIIKKLNETQLQEKKNKIFMITYSDQI